MAQITLRSYLQETEDALSAQRIDDALANCQYILAYFPDSLEAQRLLGEVYLAQGRLDEARQAFDWVLTNDPENVIAYCSRALVSERTGDYDTALDCYQQAYELSRGNNQIRQAFNQLSEKAGQQGFMFSRAGLARLYMRGNLLPQAVQEWEAVLTTTPDRLDARTGLLEAYWRLGLLDRASQLATRILQDVPGCLKALLLLAHVTAPQDMLQSQELIKRTEALDPDLMMAQDLFADLIVSQKSDPFFKLLKKDPATFTANVVSFSSSDANVQDLHGFTSDNQQASNAFALSADSLAQWGNLENWQNDVTLPTPPAQQEQPFDPASTPWLAPQSNDAVSGTGSFNGSLSGISQSGISQSGISLSGISQSGISLSGISQSGSSLSGISQSGISQSDISQSGILQSGSSLSGISQSGISQSGSSLSGISQSGSFGSGNQWTYESPKEQSWDTFDTKGSDSEAASGQVEPWQMMQNALNDVQAPVQKTEEKPADMFSTWQPAQSTGEVTSSAAPVWLSMLGEGESGAHNRVMPESRPTAPVLPSQSGIQATSLPVPEPVVEPPAAPLHTSAQQAEPQAVQEQAPAFALDDDEESFFGPDWLKSLGAASLGDSMEMPAIKIPPAQAAEKTEVAQAQPVQPHVVAESVPVVPTEEPVAQVKAAQENVFEAEKKNTWLDDLAPLPQSPVQDDSWQSLKQENTVADLWPDATDGMGTEGYQPNTAAYTGNDDWSAPVKEQPSWLSQITSSTPEQPSWLSQISATPAKATPEVPVQSDEPHESAKTEQNLVATLEELEQKLRSRGFIPLEPNSLSQIAQTQQGQPVPAETAEAEPEKTTVEPSLSSAFAELSNAQYYTQPVAPPVEQEQAYPYPQQPQAQQEVEPEWITALRSTPASTYAQPAAEVVTQSTPAFEQPATYAFSAQQEPVQAAPVMPQELPLTPPTQIAHTPPVAPTAYQPVQTQRIEPYNVPLQNTNPLLNSELEVTMRRPAVRLQRMQQRPTTPALQQPGPSVANNMAAATRGAPKANDGTLTYHERLRKGYQSQLIGEYDSAMQEYRLIIRSAPELLGDVISNVRALLKIAPKYSAGYRVLGDAYMRQGEYLQAMEAYNKALTMAKKTKN